MCRRDGLARVKESLTKRRDVIQKELERSRASLAPSHPDSPVDFAEAAVGTLETEMSSRHAETKSQELKRIDEALVLAKKGELGLCETCGANIPIARLNAVPGATMCVKCQHEAEQRTPGPAQRTSYAFLADVSSDDELVRPGEEPVD